MIAVGQTARRTRLITPRDIELFTELTGDRSVFLETTWRFLAPVRPGDVITAEVEVLESRTDKPVTRLRTTVATSERVVLDGEAVVWRDPIVAARIPTPFENTER